MRAVMTRQIRFGDCDPARIVFYPRFYIWFDNATENLFRRAGMAWETLLGTEEGAFAGVPLVHASADFRFACRMGDEIRIESWIDEWQARAFVVRHEIVNITGGDRLSVEGREVRVWVIRDSTRPAGIRAVAVPEEVRGRLATT